MPRIFLSHASSNNREAVALKQWLSAQNPRLANEIFLDLDSSAGIRTGERWADALRRANARCEAVVCLLSRDWESSVECLTEYRTAENFDKRLFVARLEPETGSKTSAWQWCDLFGSGPMTTIDIGDGRPVQFATEGLYRLRDGIRGAGIGADTFEWPVDDPGRAPYRGWHPFEPNDAGIFFGRDAQIVRALGALRGMRKTQTKTWFVILGPSGSGKSSFLRAGLVPRLQKDDREFLVLGIIRPERDVMEGPNGFAKAIFTTRQQFGLLDPPLGDVESACYDGAQPVRELLRELQDVAHIRQLERDGDAQKPTIVLPLDQAEELVGDVGMRQSERFLSLIRDITADRDERLDLIVGATIRSDHFEGLQIRDELANADMELFGELRPMPSEQFKEVIVGPAARVSEAGRPLTLQPELIDRLLADCRDGSDALPLLSLTLERLYEKYGTSTELTLEHYKKIGGLGRVVQTIVDSVLDGGTGGRKQQLEHLRSAFIPWLATISSHNDQPTRRVARWRELPEASWPLIDSLVANRLMVKDRRDDEVVVEVALESLLWQWDDLAGWLNEYWRELKSVEDLERAAAAWEHNGHDQDWLLTGARLAAAEELLETPDFAARLVTTRTFVDACRRRELWRTTSERLIRSSRELLASNSSTGLLRAVKQILAARLLSDQSVDDVCFAASIRLRTTRAILEIDANRLAFSADRRHLTTVGEGIVTRWDADAPGRVDFRSEFGTDWWPIALSGHGERLALSDVSGNGIQVLDLDTNARIRLQDIEIGKGSHDAGAFSTDGHFVAAVRDRLMQVWDARSGELISRFAVGGDPKKRIYSLEWTPDDRFLATRAEDGTWLWGADTGRPATVPFGSGEVAFSADGSRLTVVSEAGVIVQATRTGDVVGGPWPVDGDGRTTVEFTPDGEVIVVSGNHAVELWATQTGWPVSDPMRGHDEDSGYGAGQMPSLRAVAVSPDQTTLATCGSDDTVRIWGLRDWRPAQCHGGRSVAAIAFVDDDRQITTSGYDSFVRTWDRATLQMTRETYVDHIADQLRESSEGRFISSGWKYVGQFTDLLTGQKIEPPVRLGIFADAHALSPDGRYLATGSLEGVRIWDMSTGASVGPLLRCDQTSAVAFSPDGRFIATGGYDGTARLWDAATHQPREEPLVRYPDGLRALVFSPDGSLIATASDEGVQLWDTASQKRRGKPIGGRTAPATGVAFSPDGHYVATASNDGVVQMWDAVTLAPHGKPLEHAASVSTVAFSPDGRLVVTVSRDSTIQLWDFSSQGPVGKPLEKVCGQTVEFSSDGSRIAAIASDGSAQQWDVPSLDLVDSRTVNGMRLVSNAAPNVTDGLYALSIHHVFGSYDVVSGEPIARSFWSDSFHTPMWAVSAAADYLAVEAGNAHLWDLETGNSTPVGPTITNGLMIPKAFSPDGRLLALYEPDNGIHIWDVVTGRPATGVFGGDVETVIVLTFSPDGRSLATADFNGTVRLWDVATGQQRGSPLEGIRGFANSLAFCGDGTRLIVGIEGKGVQIWQIGAERVIGLAIPQAGQVSVAVSKRGDCVATGGSDGTVRLWPVITQPDSLRSKLTAGMTAEQWREWVSPDIPHMDILGTSSMRDA